MADSAQCVQNGQHNLPPEIWTRIFEQLNGPQPNSLVAQRLVCKFWRKVIDENISFQVTVDQRFDLARHTHLRVNHFIAKKSKTNLAPELCLFSDPKLVTKFDLDCPLKRDDFFVLFSQFQNLEELSLRFKYLDTSFKPSTDHETEIFCRIFSNLKKLEVDDYSFESNQLNYLQIISSDMPKLEYLSVYLHSFNINYSGLVPLLNDRAPNLKHLRITCETEHRTPTYNPASDLEIKPFQLRALQLKTVHPYWNENWVPFLRLQRSLERLRIELKNPYVPLYNPDFYLQFTDFEDILVRNMTTLKSLELKNFLLSAPLNESFFYGMVHLKTLALVIVKEERTNHRFNLSILPESIESLKLVGFKCENEPVVNNVFTQLKKLKYFHVEGIHVESSNLRDGIQGPCLFSHIISSQMTNLTTLSLKFDKFNLDDSGLVPFLMEDSPCLEHLLIECLEEYSQPASESERNLCNLELKHLYLKEIDLDITEKCHVATWIPLIKLQRSLEILTIRHHSTKLIGHVCPEMCLDFHDLQETLTLNRKTLQALTVGEFTLSTNLNAAMFQDLEKLEKLRLKHHSSYPGTREFNVYNLSLLPDTVKDTFFFHLPTFDDDDNSTDGVIDNVC